MRTEPILEVQHVYREGESVEVLRTKLLSMICRDSKDIKLSLKKKQN